MIFTFKKSKRLFVEIFVYRPCLCRNTLLYVVVKILKYIFSPIDKRTLLFTIALAFYQYIALFNSLRMDRN